MSLREAAEAASVEAEAARAAAEVARDDAERALRPAVEELADQIERGAVERVRFAAERTALELELTRQRDRADDLETQVKTATIRKASALAPRARPTNPTHHDGPTHAPPPSQVSFLVSRNVEQALQQGRLFLHRAVRRSFYRILHTAWSKLSRAVERSRRDVASGRRMLRASTKLFNARMREAWSVWRRGSEAQARQELSASQLVRVVKRISAGQQAAAFGRWIQWFDLSVTQVRVRILRTRK